MAGSFRRINIYLDQMEFLFREKWSFRVDNKWNEKTFCDRSLKISSNLIEDFWNRFEVKRICYLIDATLKRNRQRFSLTASFPNNNNNKILKLSTMFIQIKKTKHDPLRKSNRLNRKRVRITNYIIICKRKIRCLIV